MVKNKSEELKKALTILNALPLLIPTTVIFVGIFVYLGVLLKVNSNLSVIFAFLFGLVVSYLVYKRLHNKSKKDLTKEVLIFDILILLGVLAWSLFNVFYVSQNTYVQRDPGIYTVASQWLSKNNSLLAEVDSDYLQIEGVKHESAGYGENLYDKDSVDPQGMHLFPSIMGAFGRFFGASNMLKIAPFFGGLAILALYAFAREFVKARWAFFASLCFSLSLPLIYFSRDTYTEPMAVAIAFSAMTMFLYALTTKSKLIYIASAALAGSLLFNRADGLLLGICIGALSIVLSLVIQNKRQQTNSLMNVNLYLVTLGIFGLIGWFDISRYSSNYYSDIGKDVKLQLLLVLLLLAANIVLTLINSKTKKPIKIVSKVYYSKWFKLIFLITVVFLLAYILSRPLWLISRDPNTPESISNYIGGLQHAEGQIVDETRNYAEQTSNWMVWYLGLTLSLASIGGLLISSFYSLEKKGEKYLVPVFVFVGISLVFMTLVIITPDHIWASRRFLPITIPGICFFASVLFATAFDSFKKHRYLKLVTRISVLFIAYQALVGVYKVSEPLLYTQSYENQYYQVENICKNLEDDSVVLWAGSKGWNNIQTIRSFCGLEAFSIENLTVSQTSEFSKIAAKNSKKPMLIVTGSEYYNIPFDLRKGMVEVSQLEYEFIPSRLMGLPEEAIIGSRSIFIGQISSDGTTYPIRFPIVEKFVTN